MIHVDNVEDFYKFLQCLGECTKQDRGDHWFFFFPRRAVYITFLKDGPLVQPYFSDKMLADQVKTGWPVYAGRSGKDE